MVGSKEWGDALGKPWELGGVLRWHVFIGYSSDSVAVIELYDALTALGYGVLHARHSQATQETFNRSDCAVEVQAGAGADPGWIARWNDWVKGRAGLRRVPVKVKDWTNGPTGINLLKLVCEMSGTTPATAAFTLGAAIDVETGEALKNLKKKPAIPSERGAVWEGGPFLGNRVGEALIKAGRYEDAIKVLEEVGRQFPGTLRWRQLKGSALARWGHLAEAQEIFRDLYEEGQRDPETLGIHARTWMDSYDKSGNKDELRRSRDLYAEAFRIAPTDYYPGINAAAKSVLLGEMDAARGYNQRVQKIVGTEKAAESDDYWLLATDGESQLIDGNYDEAAKRYQAAVKKYSTEKGSQYSTWLQARRLMKAVGTPEAEQSKIWAVFQRSADAAPDPMMFTPPARRLRVFAFDPSMGQQLATAPINEMTLEVPWEADRNTGESTLQPGPKGEYLEVVDEDPASDITHEPVDLNDPRLLAMDGLAPSEGEPRFHQQMVYAVAMNLIDEFEGALGRRALWASRASQTGGTETFVRRLRIQPHAFNGTNAYYSPEKKAVLFGYFKPRVDDIRGMVYTCLSHDVVAHEMTHALVDGLHPRFTEPSNPDVFALHEAMADLIALFLRFSNAQALRHEIARTRSDLGAQNLLSQLAQQFGRATGKRGALRDALGGIDKATGKWQPKPPDPGDLKKTTEPHARGAILVAAVFDAFLAIYQSRTADLLRIATQGSGILPLGALHPDLISRLAAEAAKVAGRFLRICIRALDYCPPVDVTFGDYLRAMVTSDVDYVHDDRHRYRLAILEGFQRRGIYPEDVQNLSVESVVWRPPRNNAIDWRPLFAGGRLRPEWRPTADREELWNGMRRNSKAVQDWLGQYCSPSAAEELGLALGADAPWSLARVDGRVAAEVHSVRVALRNTPDGGAVTDIVVEILQERRGYFQEDKQKRIDGDEKGDYRDEKANFKFHGGCTLLIDPSDCRIRYAIAKNILSAERLRREREFRLGRDGGDETAFAEPFKFLHGGAEGESS